MFSEPASVRQISEELVVTEAAVKQHLLHLYDKFGIVEAGERRRVRLAREAIRRGAVDVRDLTPETSTAEPAEIRYVRSGDVNIAYQIVGNGPATWCSCPASSRTSSGVGGTPPWPRSTGGSRASHG